MARDRNERHPPAAKLAEAETAGMPLVARVLLNGDVMTAQSTQGRRWWRWALLLALGAAAAGPFAVWRAWFPQNPDVVRLMDEEQQTQQKHDELFPMEEGKR